MKDERGTKTNGAVDYTESHRAIFYVQNAKKGAA